jgi:peptide/nickel transport system permease protein
MVLLAGFFAPYDPEIQNRELPFVPPTRIHWVDTQGRLHLRPFVYRVVARPGSLAAYEEDQHTTCPIRFFVPGVRYKIAGLSLSRRHLFGVEEPARIFIMGTDAYGRDQFSRLLYGGRISLSGGLLAASLSLGLGLLLGAVAGFYRGWLDDATMRAAELFLALPWLYLLFAVRAFLPLHISPAQAFLLLISVVGVIGWARPARLVRGVVLTARERAYVLAARGFGASDFYVLRRHILPQTSSVLLTQAALLIPQYILAEVILSFLGLGVSEPSASWGTMLAGLQQYHVLASYWWMFLPGLVLIPIFVAYYTLADALRR